MTPERPHVSDPRPAGESSTLSAAEAERQFFDGFVAEEGAFDPFTPHGWNTLRKAFRKMTPAIASSRLLDIGCGTGSSLRVYEGRFEHYAGVDLSPASIDAARRKSPAHEWLIADACQLPFADGSFETVAFSSVLHHLPDMALGLSEAYRVLKPGGVVFAFDPNILHPAMALFRHPRSPLYSSKGVSPNERPLHPATLRAAFESAGFQSIRQRCQSEIGYRQVAPRAINALIGAFNIVDAVWERIGLGRFFGTFVLTSGVKPQ
jgi:SAM-dependent methyltransferase